MDRSWINSKRFDKPYRDGVSEFMKLVSENFGADEQILCPCRKCLNRISEHKGKVEDHLYIYGMASMYTRWIYHGEPMQDTIIENTGHQDEQIHFTADVNLNEVEEADPDDRIPDMVQELFTSEEEGPRKKSMFAILLEELKQELYPGAAYSRFSFVVKLLHIKSFYRISNVAFTAFVKLLADAFPHCSIPASYEEAKKLIRALGLGYNTIHVCPNNCVLFLKNYAALDVCPVCSASRWKDKDGRKKIPEKVLRHFPLIPRLKRMFASKEISELAQWHKLKRNAVENELSHPADGEAWKAFDTKYAWFAQDARNIRLGLATDGFNPFGKMNSSYSMWPVFLIPYNFPPWECMEQSNFMMGLLIPGPLCPGKDFDVFLEPLIEELLDLWKGVSTLDALTGKSFDLHAAVIWCIHDYPALSTLSGRVTRGYYACVRCDKDPCSRRIRNKICYIGHRRFVPRDHPWRKKKWFDGKDEEREKPEEFSSDELKQQLERVMDVRPGMHPQNKKRKREENGQCWKRRSSLWDLPYWSSLKLRHNLDVMHIEKNICEYILGTFLGIAGKTKDTVNGRLDLEDMGIRKNLHLKRDGNSYSVPHAPYVLTKTQKLTFCEFLRSVKFPDGYASNLATCISVDGCNLQGLKTHDCHILLQRILPAAVRGILHKDIYEAISELGNLFQKLCAKTLKIDVLHRMKDEIPIILCKLETIFPPPFFDVMLHLAVHLPDEAILRGPVQYGWMYPVERRLYTLKRFVRNMARPEGSIAEAYVAKECLMACSRYFDDVDTRYNREGRNRERVDLRTGDLSVFCHGVHLLGAPNITYLEHDYDKMVWFVLNNCPEVEPYIKYVILWTALFFMQPTNYEVSQNVPCNTIIGNAGARGSKRVRALDEQDQIQPPRVTRQKAKELIRSEEGVHDTTTTMQEDALTIANCLNQTDHDTEMCNEGQSNCTVARWNKGKSMGRDLDRISRGLNTRIPVLIAEGKKRPEPPMQAAKLASEGGIILRQHVPIFTHWKEYKDDKNKDILPSYMGKIVNQLAIDTDSEPVKEACADLLRSGTRQMRYNLKKLYFNGVPADKVRTTSPLKSMTDDQWRELVEMWSSPKHKDKCAKNALNREKVRFHQMTGSRCYIATTHALKQEKYKDEPPSAIDLFKALHCSSKTGFNESAKEAIAEMESIAAAPVEEGQVSKTPAEVVAQVLPKSKFLQNIGLKLAAPKRSSKAVNDARVIELEAEVVAGKQDKEELKDEMETLKKKVEESENERRRLLEETEQLKKAQDELKKAQDETNAFFRRMFNKE